MYKEWGSKNVKKHLICTCISTPNIYLTLHYHPRPPEARWWFSATFFGQLSISKHSQGVWHYCTISFNSAPSMTGYQLAKISILANPRFEWDIQIFSAGRVLICVAWGWMWKCETRETRIKCLRKTLQHLTLTHTNYLNISARVWGLWYWKISLVSQVSIILFYYGFYVFNRKCSPKTLQMIGYFGCDV